MAGQQHLEAGARVSVLLHPLRAEPAPLRLREIGPAENIGMPVSSSCGTNASTYACYLPPLRLSWAERLARNARMETSGQVAITLFGIPAGFATSLGFGAA